MFPDAFDELVLKVVEDGDDVVELVGPDDEEALVAEKASFSWDSPPQEEEQAKGKKARKADAKEAKKVRVVEA